MSKYSCDFCHKEFFGIANKCMFCEGSFCQEHINPDKHNCKKSQERPDVWDKRNKLTSKKNTTTTLAIIAFFVIGIILGLSFIPNNVSIAPEANNQAQIENAPCILPHSLYVPYDSALAAECANAANR